MNKLIRKFMMWSALTFNRATPQSSLVKLQEEIQELETELNKTFTPEGVLLEEYVDCLMCLLHSAASHGFNVEDIRTAFKSKLKKNMKRRWGYNPDKKTYYHL